MIEVDALSKVYPGGVEAVRGISFAVEPGEVFGLLGPNGAGKSTTVGMLTTTILPTAGTARLWGFDVAEQPLRARDLERGLPRGRRRPRAHRTPPARDACPSLAGRRRDSGRADRRAGDEPC